MIGTRLGHYEITAKLGEGGMGVVYRAKDLQLGRDVALKVLPAALAEDPGRGSRLEREARVLASLNHPNIAQIYGYQVDGDTRVIIMELVEGPTLAEHLAGGMLPLDECLSISTQIIQALAEAHDKGIVHRDLKPQNIKLTRNGRVKVLDFGLAVQRLAGSANEAATALSAATIPGAVLGTIGYMSPEQVRGSAVDTRADIFSFGCVLYEMATGERAFASATPVETLTSILHDSPVQPSRRRRDLPSGLDRVVAHCLEKSPTSRFQSARDLEFALASLADAPTAASAQSRIPTVAVLPFVNLSTDSENEFFADGITEDVIAHLAKIRSLKVISRTSVMQFKRSDRSLREIGEKLGAATLLEGSVRRAGNRVRIVAQLVEAETDQHIWAETYDRDLTDIFAIQTDVSLNIANALRAELSTGERDRVHRIPTDNVQAYELYLRGRNSFFLFTEDGFRQSIAELNAAVALDPNFALAWASLAEAHAEISIQGATGANTDTIRLAKFAAARALELDNELAEAHGINGFIQFLFDFDWEGAERSILRALELSPGSAEIHDHYGWLCASVERYDDAIREIRKARELNPLLIQVDLANTLLRAGRIAEALEELQRAVKTQPASPRCRATLGWALLFHGDHKAAIESLKLAADLSPGATLFLSQLGEAYALSGDTGSARRILAQLNERATRETVSPYHFAYIHAGLGEADAAMDYLEQAFEQRSGAIYGIKGSFLFKNLKQHPRFQALLRRMNLA